MSYLGRFDLAQVDVSETQFDALGKGVDEGKPPQGEASRYVSRGLTRSRTDKLVVMPGGSSPSPRSRGEGRGEGQPQPETYGAGSGSERGGPAGDRGAASPSPRSRGEGRGEGQPQPETYGLGHGGERGGPAGERGAASPSPRSRGEGRGEGQPQPETYGVGSGGGDRGAPPASPPCPTRPYGLIQGSAALKAQRAPAPTDALDNLPWSPGATEARTEARARAAEKRAEAKAQGFEGEACGDCGNFTLLRSGTCLKCNTCGSTTGCS